MISYFVPANSSAGGQPVTAEATFTTGADTITIELENLESNPISVVQNVSGLIFTVSTGQISGTLTSSSALERIVHGDKSFTDGLMVATGWSLATHDSSLSLNVLGTAIGPAHTLLGPPGGTTYAHANGSIAGNRPHNPFLAGMATFVIHAAGVTPGSSISAVTFVFGTTPGANTTGANVPEPESWVLAATAFVGLLSWRRRSSTQKRPRWTNRLENCQDG
ncbi:MAG: hypothetical protein HY288_09400 [Planctomycetia bacterium]|nr:hypothetical protein [Planctomycetia bacterium]